ncbi:hypothetical protein V8B97DRAFT_1865372 [Scleroderma yunnanense]
MQPEPFVPSLLGHPMTLGSSHRSQAFLVDKSKSSKENTVSSTENQSSPVSLPPLTIRHTRDFPLAVEIRAAERDKRECPLYTVYNRILRDFIFNDCDGEQCICSITPQYSLIAEYDTGHSLEKDDIEASAPRIRAPLLLPPPSFSQPVSPQPSSDVSMSSPTDRNDSVWLLPYVPVHPGPCDMGSPLSSISSSSPTMDPSFSLVYDVQAQPQTPTVVSTWDTNSPLSPLPSSVTAAVPHSHATRMVPLPTSPTPEEKKSATHSLGLTRELRRSLRRTSGPLFPAQSTPPEIPETPPRDKKVIIRKSTRIPDFIGVLHAIRMPRPSVEALSKEFVLPDDLHIAMRTILIVEIKSGVVYAPNVWQRTWEMQVKGQALHAFGSHPDLDCLGVIIAVGRRWIYVNVNRPLPDGLTHSQRCDPDYIPSPDVWSDKSSDASSEIAEISPLAQSVPDLSTPSMEMVAPKFISNQPNHPPEQPYIESLLLDSAGQSELFFKEILEDLRKHNQDIWK